MENSDSLKDFGGTPMLCVIAQGGSNNNDRLMPWTRQIILSLVEDTAVISSVYAQLELVGATAGQPLRFMSFQGIVRSGRLRGWK